MSPLLGARRRNALFGLAVLVTGTVGGTFAVFGSAAQASVSLSCPQGNDQVQGRRQRDRRLEQRGVGVAHGESD